MSFRVVITKDYTEMNRTTSEKLAGLSCYIKALSSKGIPRHIIEEAIKCGFMSDEELDRKDKELDRKIEKLMKILFD